MRRSFWAAFILLLIICPFSSAQERFNWGLLDALPAGASQAQQVGVAGSFTGMSGDVLIVAGGANFPDKPFWKGGIKVYHDDIFILEKNADGKYQWLRGDFKLPRPLAYGVAVSTDEGLICIGGCDSEWTYSDVFAINWNKEEKQVAVTELPPLPRPLAFMSGAKVGDMIIVAGGQESISDAQATKDFFALDFSKIAKEKGFAWKELQSWPGPERILAVAAAQNDGRGDKFFLFSGRNAGLVTQTQFLTDGYKFDPKANSWTKLSDVTVDGQARCIMAAPVSASGVNHILVFGGDDGVLFRELETFAKAIEVADSEDAGRLKAQRDAILENYPGFSRDVLAYHTVTDTWIKADQLPGQGHVTATAVNVGDRFIIPSGEIGPGVRTPDVIVAFQNNKGDFGWVNYTVLGVYLAVLVCMGFYFSSREKSTDDFFRAGRRIPWWAAGMSIFGTQLSAITFMAIPAKSYMTDWRHFLWNTGIILVAPVVIYIFLPFYRRLNITTAYEYLEKRFNLAARIVSSVMFMMFQLGRLAIVLFLPSIALSVVTGIDISICIIVMGLLSIVYTVLGGIEAVIWTDVLQVIVLLGGAILCIIMIPLKITGGVGEILNIAREASKMKTFDFELSFFKDTFWVIIIGGFFNSLISYGSDQTVIQRYLTTKDENAAARGIWTNVVLSVIATVLFFGMGTALYAFFKTHPDQLNLSLSKGDAIFPLYIVTQLPVGVSGLLIAGVFAASMSSLDSSMNSVATAVTTDFYKRFNPGIDDIKCLKFARWITVIVGLAGTGIALMMAGWGIMSLWDQYNMIIGFFAGGLLGIFLLGMLTRRTHGVGAVLGLLLSGVVQCIVKFYTPTHAMFYTFTGVSSCFIAGYVLSIIIPSPKQQIEGLTVYSMAKKNESK